MSDVITRFRYDESEDRLIIQRTQDCDPIVEWCKRRSDTENAKRGKDMYHVGKIPAVIVEAFCRRRGVTFADLMRGNKLLRELLNDRDLGNFRIWKGRL